MLDDALLLSLDRLDDERVDGDDMDDTDDDDDDDDSTSVLDSDDTDDGEAVDDGDDCDDQDDGEDDDDEEEDTLQQQSIASCHAPGVPTRRGLPDGSTCHFTFKPPLLTTQMRH